MKRTTTVTTGLTLMNNKAAARRIARNAFATCKRATEISVNAPDCKVVYQYSGQRKDIKTNALKFIRVFVK